MRGLVARFLVAAFAVMSSTVAVPAWSAAVTPEPCSELALSPTFATDGTAVCAGVSVDRSTGVAIAATVFVTTDKGHSWRKASATGIAISRSDDYVRGVVLSPRYSSDHMVFVQLARAGLFSSVDRGESFTLVSPLGLGRVTPYVAIPSVLGAAARPLLLHANAAGNDVSMQVDPASRALAPVAGTPGADREFAVSPRYATDGLAFAAAEVTSADGTSTSPAVYACNAGFACADQRFLGPARATFDRLRVLPAATPSGFVVVVQALVGATPRMWRSVDGGRTFQPWKSVNAIVATFGSGPSQLAVAADPAAPNRMYLRTSWISPHGSPPDDQVFVSTDAGSRWTRVAYGTMVGLRHTGAIPPTSTGGYRDTAAGLLAAGGGGRLFMLTGDRGSPEYTGPYCSRDGGRSWARFC
jgi:hypothetical protein